MNRRSLPPSALIQLAAVTDGYLRVGPIQGLPSLLRALGQDPDTVIRGAGVDPELLADPENFIGFTALGRLLAACAASTACPHFGLLLGQRTGLEALGLVGLLAEHSPNVGSALHNLVLHLHLHDRGAVPTLVIEGECALFGYAIYQPGVEGTRQIYDGALAIVFNILKALCGPLWQPTEVLFSHSKPANSEPFRRFFQARLRFDAERSALVFSAACLRQPLGGSNPLLRKLLEERIALLESLGAGDIVSQVRRVLHHRRACGGMDSPSSTCWMRSVTRSLANCFGRPTWPSSRSAPRSVMRTPRPSPVPSGVGPGLHLALGAAPGGGLEGDAAGAGVSPGSHAGPPTAEGLSR